ncbi:MAG: hypothetical protein ACXAAN_14795 [Candidatus Thorarchaeota archaeon]|jgi:thermostable 8-oxoguanine DNA glycosylase
MEDEELSSSSIRSVRYGLAISLDISGNLENTKAGVRLSSIDLPEPKSIVDAVLDVRSTEPDDSKSRSIKSWMRILQKRSRNLMKASNDHKFFEFVARLLARQTNESWWGKIIPWFLDDISIVDNIPSKKRIEEKLRSMGYRFPPQGAQVILDAKKVYKSELNEDWRRYFKLAKENVVEGFRNDPFLDIKYVSFKVRDLALADFTLAYPVIDFHVIDVLRRTGLICYSYMLGEQLSTSNSGEDYHSIRRTCLGISEMVELKPALLDRLLWHFGKSICKTRPDCETCPLTMYCLYWQGLQNR